MIYSWSLRDWAIFQEITEKASAIILILGSILAALIFRGSVSFGTYSMSFSYYMLLPAIIYLNKLFNKPSLKFFSLTALAAVIILSLGARGPFLALAGFSILKLFQTRGNLTAKQLLGRVFLILLGIVAIVYFQELLTLIADILADFGIRSRSINLFLRSGVHMSGRDSIYQRALKALVDSPILGLGLAGDRLLVGGSYVHNLFLEILLHFGIIVGSFCLGLFFLLIINILVKGNDLEYELAAIWFGLGFMPLMVSHTYLTAINFWILAGLLLGAPSKCGRNRKGTLP